MPVAIARRQLRDDDGDDEDGPRHHPKTSSIPSATTIDYAEASSSAAITASPSCCTKSNEVLIQLSTTITITDYQRYYNTPIQSFVPTYHTLPDGSLVTPPYISDLKETHFALIYCTVLTVVFFRNIIVSGGYIRRGKIKKKCLFYLLFASQLLGPVVLLPFLIVHFTQYVDCTIVYLVTSIACFVSIWILVTGILGVKAYLCLDRSRFVVLILAAIQIIWLSIAVDELTGLRGERRLSGGCNRHTNGMVHVFVVMQCAQAFFISCCFVYAVWKSSGVPAARSRISLQLSMDDLHETDSHSDDDNESNHIGRGWWDYVPRNEKPASSARGRAFRSALAGGIFRSWRSMRKLWTKSENSAEGVFARKPSLPGDVPLPQPPRPSAVRISGNDQREITRPRSPMPSLSIYRSGLIPRMVLCREVMRDELYYTTFITATCVVVTVLVVIGVNSTKTLSVSSWLLLNWTIISLLAIHSFGRVVRRHEIEAMRQHPWSWNPNFRTDQRNADTLRQVRTRRPWSPPHSIASYRRGRRNIVTTPQDDTSESERRLCQPSGGYDSRSITRSTSRTSLRSRPPSPSIDSSLRIPLHHEPGIIPSPISDVFKFPSSSRLTGADVEHTLSTQANLLVRGPER